MTNFKGDQVLIMTLEDWDVSMLQICSCLMVPQHSINQLGIGMYHQSQMLHGCLMEPHRLTKIFKIGILPTWSIWMECLKECWNLFYKYQWLLEVGIEILVMLAL